MNTRPTTPEQAGNALQALLKLPHVDARNDMQVTGAILDHLRNQFPMDADLLAQGSASGIARRMREQPRGNLDQTRVDELVMQLSKHRGISLDDARWVVAAWAHALGIGLPSGSMPHPPPPPKTGGHRPLRLVVLAMVVFMAGIVFIKSFPHIGDDYERATESNSAPTERNPKTQEGGAYDPAIREHPREDSQAESTHSSSHFDDSPTAPARTRQRTAQYYASSATIVIFASGFSVNGESMTEAQLKSFLEEMGKRNSDCRIVIHLNSGASTDDAERVKQMCTHHGLKKIFTKNLQ